MYLCVLCASENKKRLFPYEALSDWFYNRDILFTARYGLNCYFCFGMVLFSVRTWLGRLVTGLLRRRPGFDPRSVHLRFVVGKGAQWQVFTQLLWCFPVSIIPPCTIFIHLPPTLYNAFLIVVPFPRVSFIPPMHRTHLHLHAALTRSLVTFQKVGLFLSPSSRHAAR